MSVNKVFKVSSIVCDSHSLEFSLFGLSTLRTIDLSNYWTVGPTIFRTKEPSDLRLGPTFRGNFRFFSITEEPFTYFSRIPRSFRSKCSGSWGLGYVFLTNWTRQTSDTWVFSASLIMFVKKSRCLWQKMIIHTALALFSELLLACRLRKRVVSKRIRTMFSRRHQWYHSLTPRSIFICYTVCFCLIQETRETMLGSRICLSRQTANFVVEDDL